MNWATHAIETLQRGENAQIRPRGHSMNGKINNGQLVTLQPYKGDGQLPVGTIVLVNVKGRVFLHLIKAVNGSRYLIGNNRGGTNGWVRGHAIYGIVTKVE